MLDSQQKKYLIAIISVLVVMIALVFVTAGLTDWKDTDEWLPRDTTIFTVFLFVEFLLLAVMIAIAVKAGRYNNAVRAGQPIKKELTGQEKAYFRRGSLMLIFSMLSAIVLAVSGILLCEKFPMLVFPGVRVLFTFCLLFPFACIPINYLLNLIYLRSVKGRQVAEVQKAIFSQREYAETTSVQKLSLLHTLRGLMTAAAAFHFLLASVAAFYLFVLVDSNFQNLILLAVVFIFFNVYSRIPFKSPDAVFEDDKTFVSEADFPILYATARRAAEKLDIRGDVRVSLSADCNAGITSFGDVYAVQIGVVMLYCFTEDELYNILLHEFAHMAGTNQPAVREYNFYRWLTVEKPNTAFSRFSSLLISHIDVVYSVQYELYRYASSVLKEQIADRAMAEYGTAEVAASALLKLNYHSLFDWEKGTHDRRSLLFDSETPKNRYVTEYAESFCRVIERNKDEWNALTAVEILARSATHPTTRLRMEMLGVSEYRLCEDDRSEAFLAEQKRALAYIDALIVDSIGDAYEDIRREEYLEPLEIVETWEAIGKPIVAEEYADVVQALRKLGRNREAIALCRRAVEELPDIAAANAYFILGCHYLRCYDQEGVGYLYKAIALNSNYIDEGLDTIGSFCCLTGRQDELDAYREMAMSLVQKQVDEYDEANTLSRKDDLSQETELPSDLLDSIIKYIAGIDDGTIRTVYLVRKTVTERFFTSVFVIRFKDGVPAETQEELLHKVFRYLDTCSDWQFSLFNFKDVPKVRLDQIDGSIVYDRKD